MELNADKLNFILGVKVKNHRQAKGLSLKDLSEKTGLSISYLSEIEKGKKYPKLEKLILLAESLGVSFDDLVSMKIDETLDPLKEILDSEFVQGFPFHIFGIQPKEIIHIVLESPDKARALVRTFLEISRIYEVRVEHFLFAALRSFQQQHMNYFEELEEASLKFRKENSLSEQVNITLEQLQIILKDKFSYEIDETTLDSYPELQGLRSIWIKGSRPKLLINRRLMNSQKAFIIAREIGYCYLKLKERAITSSWIRVESFD
ncbi:MAG: helix-turn-helix transcriptional regulator, partial [Blastocatellia bacterium]|nr:helix-turn-helix transcriptional regulator [Blastocatellia bacterium]